MICILDTEGQSKAELVGVCGDVPTYCVKDLFEVLETLTQNYSAPLNATRPLKIVNYLKV